MTHRMPGSRRSVVEQALRLAYPAAAAADIVLAAVGRQHLRRWTKPLLMPLLAARVGAVAAPDRTLIGAGLVLSGAGDIALLGKGKKYFVAGLGAFLTAHLAYTAAFARHGAGQLRHRPLLSVPPAVLVAGVSATLAPRAGKLAGAVVGYAVVIGGMAAMAAATGRRRVQVGAALFCLSDLLLAINRFGRPFGGADALVMVTYAAAQHEILAGMANPAGAGSRRTLAGSAP